MTETSADDALVLRPGGALTVEPFPITETLSPDDVRIRPTVVGVCGSDLHYVDHGRIGPFVVEDPMVLGHEAAGVVVEVGSAVDGLAEGDRVCMEPGVPCAWSWTTLEGHYNLDPEVAFWATPPVHGVLRRSVVHPAAFTFKLPESVSDEEGAFVEPLAVAVHSVDKARLRVADRVVVLGAGTIGMLISRVALAAGAAAVIVTDIDRAKLDLLEAFDPRVTGVDVGRDSIEAIVSDLTGGQGVDAVFEASGAISAASAVFGPLRPGGTVVYVGMPSGDVPYDIPAAQVKEARVEHVFRYANVFPRAVRMLEQGIVEVADLVTHRYSLETSPEAFDAMRDPAAGVIKAQIAISDN